MLPVATAEQALRQFQEEVFLRNAKWDDAQLMMWRTACLTLGAFATPTQRREDAIAFEANKTHHFPAPGIPAWPSNRGYFNLLVEEAAHTPQGAAEPDKIESFRLYGDPAEPDKFSTAERRSLREFGKWLLVNGLDDLFSRFTHTAVWSLGDYKRVCDLSKTSDAQPVVRSAFRNATELKDDKSRDVGVEGPWKDDWAAIKGYTDVLKDNVGNLWKLRSMQKSARTQDDYEALRKEADSTEVKAGSFVAEDEAIGSRTAQFALAHCDLTEYVKLSPNWDSKLNWVKIPYDEHDPDEAEMYNHIRSRVNRLMSTPKTIAFANKAGRTVEEAAILQEIFFRARPLAETLSSGLVIKLQDVWDHLTDGPKMVDLLMTPAGWGQTKSMGVRMGDRFARTLLGAGIELISKRLSIRFATLLASVAVFGLVMMLGIAVQWPNKEIIAVVSFFLTWFFFDQLAQQLLRQRESRPLYVVIALVLAALLIVKFGGDAQREMVNQDLRNWGDALIRSSR